MAIRTPSTRYYKPTIGDLVRTGVEAMVSCTVCQVGHKIDLSTLLAAKGPDYSLINRRCRCRLTDGCPGWNRFYHRRSGVFLPLWDDETAARWINSNP